jgi:hypothetical protein
VLHNGIDGSPAEAFIFGQPEAMSYWMKRVRFPGPACFTREPVRPNLPGVGLRRSSAVALDVPNDGGLADRGR